MNRKDLETELKKIKWTIKGQEHHEYLVDHENKPTNIGVRSNSIEVNDLSNTDHRASCSFSFSGCDIEFDKNIVVIKAKGLKGNDMVFIQFYNFDMDE